MLKIKENEVLTQAEMLRYFNNYIQTQGKIYSKFQNIYARPGIVGEKIETFVESGKETEVTVKENHVVIRNQTTAQEEYVVSEEKFKLRYVLNQEQVPLELANRGYKCFNSIGKIKGVVAKELLSPGVNEVFFIASWGEKMRCQAEDIVAMPIGTVTEIYRIAINEFYQTYK